MACNLKKEVKDGIEGCFYSAGFLPCNICGLKDITDNDFNKAVQETMDIENTLIMEKLNNEN